MGLSRSASHARVISRLVAISPIQGQDNGWFFIPDNRNVEVGAGVELELKFSELIRVGRLELQRTLLQVNGQSLDGLGGMAAVHDLSDQRDTFGLGIEAEVHVKFISLEQELPSGNRATNRSFRGLQEGIEDEPNALVSQRSQGSKLGFGYSYYVVRWAEALFFVHHVEDGPPELDGRHTLLTAAFQVGLHGRSLLRREEFSDEIGPRCIVKVLHARLR